jgi:hypothetical protein
MAKFIFLDEFHVTVLAPRGFPAAEYNWIRQTLDKVRFRVRLGRAVRTVFRQYPSLAKVKVTITR